MEPVIKSEYTKIEIKEEISQIQPKIEHVPITCETIQKQEVKREDTVYTDSTACKTVHNCLVNRCDNKLDPSQFVKIEIKEMIPETQPKTEAWYLPSTFDTIQQIKLEDTDINDSTACSTVHMCELDTTHNEEEDQLMHTSHSPAVYTSTSSAGNSQQLIFTPDKHFSCEVCNKKFSLRGHLKTHMLTHTGHKPFTCDTCAKNFSLKENLKKHALTHTGDKPFTCDICTKKFSVRRDLKRHSLSHTGHKPFTCDICSKKFSQTANLKTHLLTHTGDKAFSCDICTKKFTLKGTLKKHLLTHTRPFSCNMCTRKFFQRASFARHLLTHTEYKPFSPVACTSTSSAGNSEQPPVTPDKHYSCGICTKKFSQSVNLKTHLRTHIEQKKFSCEVCTKKFSPRASLKRHLLIHTGYKPFSCDVCDKKFSRRGSLKKHLSTNHFDVFECTKKFSIRGSKTCDHS